MAPGARDRRLALAVGTVHTQVLCVVVAVLAIAAGATWWTRAAVRAHQESHSSRSRSAASDGLSATSPFRRVGLRMWCCTELSVWGRALSAARSGPAVRFRFARPDRVSHRVSKGVGYLARFCLPSASCIGRGRSSFARTVHRRGWAGALFAPLAFLHPAPRSPQALRVLRSGSKNWRAAHRSADECQQSLGLPQSRPVHGPRRRRVGGQTARLVLVGGRISSTSLARRYGSPRGAVSRRWSSGS